MQGTSYLLKFAPVVLFSLLRFPQKFFVVLVATAGGVGFSVAILSRGFVSFIRSQSEFLPGALARLGCIVLRF